MAENTLPRHGSDELLERKQKTSSEVLSEAPRRDNYALDKGGGDPHMNYDDKPLKDSPV